MSSLPLPVTINITVDAAEISKLQDSKYVLCLSKSIKEDNYTTSGNSIFATIPNDQLGPSMKLTWVERYQVYQSRAGVSTKIYDIDQGQTANFKPDGSAEVTGPSLPDKPIVVVNNWKGWSRMGVKVFNTTENPERFRTFYISQENPLAAQAKLTPIRTYQIFWATHVKIEDEVPDTDTEPHTFDRIEGDSRAIDVAIETENRLDVHGTHVFWGHTVPHSIGFPAGDSVNSIDLTYRNGQWARV